MEYGLVGEKLGHSFSKIIHEMLLPKKYELLPMNEQEFHAFFKKKAFKGVNITIPYKEKVMDYCTYVHPLAKEIGAVNTVVNNKGILEGYNTDYEGLYSSIENSKADIKGRTVLVLGSGGASKTAVAVSKNLGAGRVYVVSRKPENEEISYDAAAGTAEASVVINATPVGMYPDNSSSPLDLSRLSKPYAVFDLIYNPLKTKLLIQGEKMGLICLNGLEMLVGQAAAARGYFEGFVPEKHIVKKVYSEIMAYMRNIVLIGMPASGKSALGRRLAAETGRKFCDLDEEIIKSSGKAIEKIFEEHGEEYFRKLERECCFQISKNTGCVISTGGGIVKNSLNIDALKQNGLIVFIDREPWRLEPGENRPLSKSTKDMEKLYNERIGLYRKYSEITVENNGSFSDGYKALAYKLKEYTK